MSLGPHSTHSDIEKHLEPHVLRCGCGRSIETWTPITVGANYVCSSCSSCPQEKRRIKRIRNEAKNEALRLRLEPFLALPLEGHGQEWFDLAQELNVDAVALEVLVEAVHKGKWKDSTAPLLYLRKSVERLSEEWLDPFSDEGRLIRWQIFSDTALTREDRESAKYWTERREADARVTPKDLEAASQTLSVVRDQDERAVICARALGLTRAQYLSGVSDTERRRRAAAWRRLGRHGIPFELRRALRDRIWDEDGWYESQAQELPHRSTPVPRYDFQDEDRWRRKG